METVLSISLLVSWPASRRASVFSIDTSRLRLRRAAPHSREARLLQFAGERLARVAVREVLHLVHSVPP